MQIKIKKKNLNVNFVHKQKLSETNSWVLLTAVQIQCPKAVAMTSIYGR